MLYMEIHKWCCSNLQCYKTMRTQEVTWIFDGKDGHGSCQDHKGGVTPFKYCDLKCTELKSMAQSRGLKALAKKREKVALVPGQKEHGQNANPILKEFYDGMPTQPPPACVMSTMHSRPMASPVSTKIPMAKGKPAKQSERIAASAQQTGGAAKLCGRPSNGRGLGEQRQGH